MWLPEQLRLYCDHCVGESITSALDQTISMQQDSGIGNVMAFDVKTATDSSFTGSGILDSSNGCDAIFFYAF